MKNKNDINMCEGPLLGKILLFAIPLMLSSVLQLAFNAADIIVVGRFESAASLAAVGSTSPVINLLTNLFMGLSIGANVCVSNYIGAKKSKDVRETVHTAMYMAIISGLIMTVIGCTFAGPILRAMGAPFDILGLAKNYLTIYCLGMTASMIYNFGAAILRSVGDTKRPLYYLIAAGVINVILNLIFVIVFRMNVAGVALATVISQVVSAILIVRTLCKEKGDLKLYLSKISIHKDKALKIVKIGLPAGFQGALFSLSNIVIQSSVNSFGSSVVAGNSAAMNIEGFIYVSMNSFYQAAISFTGQNMGAGLYKRIGRIALTSLGCVFMVGLVMGNLANFFGKELLSVYTDNPEVIRYGQVRLSCICTIYFLCGIMDVMVGVIRGMGHSLEPMIFTIVGVCGFRLAWIYLVFARPEYHRVETVYMSYPISWLVTFLALVIMYLRISHGLSSKKSN